NGEVLSQEDFMGMSEEERNNLMKNSAAVQEKLNEAFRQYKELEKSIKEKIRALETETATEVVNASFAGFIEKYKDYPKILSHVKELQENLVENINVFVKPEEHNAFSLFRISEKKALKRRYQVNLIVDNSS